LLNRSVEREQIFAHDLMERSGFWSAARVRVRAACRRLCGGHLASCAPWGRGVPVVKSGAGANDVHVHFRPGIGSPHPRIFVTAFARIPAVTSDEELLSAVREM
jgi:hypothetical protein